MRLPSLLLLSSIFSVSFCDDNTVQISSASELISFSSNVNSGTNYSGTTVVLTADIDFTGYSSKFTRIGYSSTRFFNGTFDGQGHIISNLALNSSAQYTGLFGYSSGTTIQNVIIDDTCSFTSSYVSTSYASFTGNIIGRCSSLYGPCMIENIVNMANVTFGGNVSKNLYVSGIVGYLYSSSYTNYIKNCVNYGTVTHSGKAGSWVEVGGIVGITQGGTVRNYIQNCMNYGTITHSSTSSNLAIGGVSGVSMYSSIDNCVSSGAISTNNVSDNIGAVVGRISGSISEVTHCYWADNIEYDGIGYIDSSTLLSDNSAFSTTSFELSESVSVGTSTTTSLINALNAAADRYTLREYSHWLLNKGGHDVFFTVDNAKLSVILSSQIILLPSLAGRGSTVFRGWYTDSSCTSLLAGYDYSGESDLSLYGKFEEDSSSHTITFDTRGSTSVSPITGQFGSVVTLPTDSTRGYCEIFRWETEYGDDVPNEFTIPGQDVTLYAVWLCTHITTSNDLISFSNVVNSGTDFSGTTVFLDADIDFSGYSSKFIPIGTSTDNYFLGAFDGQGHTISNLALKSSLDSVGLFGYSYGTTTQNVVIDDTCSITSSYALQNYLRIGGIIGKCLSTIGSCTISNSVNMASVKFRGNVNENLFIGGIAGAVVSSDYSATIRNCVNYGAIAQSGTCNGSDSWAELGGIVGISQGTSTLYAYVQNCMNYGTITHSGTSRNLAIGGVAGVSTYSSIDNCVSLGTISSNQESNYIGAVVGYTSKYTEVTHYYWADDIGYSGIGYIDSSTLLSDNSASSTTSFELSETVSVGTTTTTSLIGALNAAADRYTLREYSHWLLNKGGHTVSFTVDNAKLSVTLSSQIILLPSLAGRGTTVFRGWYTDNSCASLLTDYDYSGESELSLYGKFEEDSSSHTITFDTRGGSSVSSITGQFGSVVTLPTDSTRGHCEFLKWETEYGDAVLNEFAIPSQDVTLYAVWLCTHITTVNEFISFSNVVNSGTNFSGITVFLDADIDFDGYSSRFTPIGTSTDNYFLGTFNGQGHTISNLALKSFSLYTGLFGYSLGTTIQNVVIDDTCSFVSSYVSSFNQIHVGNIIGKCLPTIGPCTIANSVNMASVVFGGDVTKNLFIGGIAGAIVSSNYTSTIRNCVNYGAVTQSGTCSGSDKWAEVGGLVGISQGTSTLYAYVQNCMNYGTITHSGTSSNLAIGGIAGVSMYSSIDNCVNSGVISTNQEGDSIGAVAGRISATSKINHCYWTSDVGNSSVYGYKTSTINASIANSSLTSLNKTIADKLNEYTSKNETWSKWFMVHLNGGRINNITQESLVDIQGYFPDPVKEGNTLLSWCKDAECNDVFDPKKDSVSGVTDIYAGWVINNYTVTFDFDNGTTVNVTFSYGSSIEYPKNLIKEGYTFNGWDNRPDLMPAENITITAQWAEAVVSKSVEIVLSTKELETKGEEELKEELKDIIKLYTNEEFIIESIEHDSDTGETKVIIKFTEEKAAEDFVRTANENKGSGSVFKRISIVSEDGNFSPRITLFSIFSFLLFV